MQRQGESDHSLAALEIFEISQDPFVHSDDRFQMSVVFFSSKECSNCESNQEVSPCPGPSWELPYKSPTTLRQRNSKSGKPCKTWESPNIEDPLSVSML